MVSLLETSDGRFVGEGAAELEALFERLAASGSPRLLLHVHGGLVGAQSARSSASRLEASGAYGPLKEQGWETSYLIWRSGFFDAVGKGLLSLGSDALFAAVKAVVRRWLARRALPFGAVAETLASRDMTIAELERVYRDAEFLPASAIGSNLTAEEIAQLDETAEPGPGDSLFDDLAADTGIQTIAHQAESALTRRRSETLTIQPVDETVLASLEKLDPAIRDAIAARFEQKEALASPSLFHPIVMAAARAGYRVLRRAISGRDHGFHATVVEELSRELYADLLGSSIWSQMKSFAANHFAVDGAGTQFIARLRALAAETSEPVRLLFVGHSAGSILACDLLEACGELPPNVIIDLIFLAPAVRMDRAADTLEAASSQIDNVRIFTMSDERERDDDLDDRVPLDLYPHSLLYLISGVLENKGGRKPYPDAPLLGLQRHLVILPDDSLSSQERDARRRVAQFLAASPSRIFFAPSSVGDGCNTDARTHGTIDEDPGTLASIRHIALHGYGTGQ